jgi:hypothetical protein
MPKLSEHEIQIGGVTYKLPNMALQLMVAAILVPAVRYSIGLGDPTPAQLLVAICIALFSSVVCLWILDSVSILRFRSEWVSRSVWGAAIVSVLGTSVGVYQGAFAERKYPYEGAWEFRVLAKDSNSFIADHSVVLIHSETANIYWGYSNTALAGDIAASKAVSAEVTDFLPDQGTITVRLILRDTKELVIKEHLKKDREGKRFVSEKSDSKYDVTLSRPR